MGAQETYLYYNLLLTGIALMMCVILFFKGSMALQQRFVQLHADKQNTALQSADEERKRIAADLHDETNGILYGLLRKTERILPADEQSSAYLTDLYAGLNDVGDSVDKIISEGIPIPAGENGLLYALQGLVVQKDGTGGICMFCEVAELPTLPPAVELQLYRIVQELTQNAIKHSGAKHLWVRSFFSGEGLQLIVEDDGTGFKQRDPGSAASGRGVANLYQRAALAGANIAYDNSRGCKVSITVPKTAF
ncbi:MAG: hypothetical protein EOO06_05415 [Chitinophagaceae bacterium]|nr:MAG: hypothetical protein EOO06_05415 [Chitinophagaceae bacterium]